MADRFGQRAVIEPIDPFEGGELDRLEALPRAAPMDHLGLERADHRLGESIIVRVPCSAARPDDPHPSRSYVSVRQAAAKRTFRGSERVDSNLNAMSVKRPFSRRCASVSVEQFKTPPILSGKRAWFSTVE